jgi:predicted dehydrogenase
MPNSQAPISRALRTRPVGPGPEDPDHRPMRVGVIGTGFGARVVAGAFAATGSEVTEVVTARQPDGVAALCRSDIDLVSIHSPPFLHADHVAMAVGAGKAVLCDKPFGTSLDEAMAMAEAAEAADIVNLVNFEFRHQPARCAVRELVASGAVGRPEHLAYTAHTSGARVPLRPWGWLFDRGRGGGWIGAFGSHAIDLVRWLLGEVTAAGATNWVTVTERPDALGTLRRCDAEDAFTGWMELDSGATAVVDSSFVSGAGLAPRIVITGSEGAIEDVGDARVVLHRSDGSREQFDFAPGPGDPHAVAMEGWATAIARAVLGGVQVAPSFADGVACMKVMEQWRALPPRPWTGPPPGSDQDGPGGGGGHRPR